MKPSLFYNYRYIGDVLIIVINPFLDMTHYVKKDNVTALYNKDELIGYNIFNISSIIKIHHQGLLVSPIQPLIDVINNILKNHDLPLLEFDNSPSFIIGKIQDVKKDCYLIDLGSEIIQVQSHLADINIGDLIVYIKPLTICVDASYLQQGRVGTKRCLTLEDSDDVLKLDDDTLIGQDFYSGEVKWSN